MAIVTTWAEACAVMGRFEAALALMREALVEQRAHLLVLLPVAAGRAVLRRLLAVQLLLQRLHLPLPQHAARPTHRLLVRCLL